MRPESYDELDAYLNTLSHAAWKGVLNAKHIGGDERVLNYLRRECGSDLDLWTDADLLEYLIARDLSENFEPVEARW